MIFVGWPRLSDLGDMASVATAVAAAGAWLYYLCLRCIHRRRLERHLLRAKQSADHAKGEVGRRSVLNTMAYCGMTEAQVLDAAYRSSKIKTAPRTDWSTGYAAGINLEYDDGA